MDYGQAILARVELVKQALAGNSSECEVELDRISALVQEQAALIRRARSALGARERVVLPSEGGATERPERLSRRRSEIP